MFCLLGELMFVLPLATLVVGRPIDYAGIDHQLIDQVAGQDESGSAVTSADFEPAIDSSNEQLHWPTFLFQSDNAGHHHQSWLRRRPNWRRPKYKVQFCNQTNKRKENVATLSILQIVCH